MTHRRNAFTVGPAQRDLPRRGAPGAAPLPAPTVPREVAELAAFITDNPVFLDIMARLRAEAVERFSGSALGPEGAPERETARHQTEALSTIEVRLGAFAAELELFPADEHVAGD